MQTVLPCLEGGGGGSKSFGPAIFPFLAPLPVINDQCLMYTRFYLCYIDTLTSLRESTISSLVMKDVSYDGVTSLV